MNQIKKVHDILLEEYGEQGWWPKTRKGERIPGYDKRNKHKRPSKKERLEITLGAILTQNTSWKNVEKTIEKLHEKGLVNAGKLKELPEKELAELIRSSGYFNQKARKIKEFLKYEGKVTREGLLSIWGIGPETADSILLYAYHRPYFVVDAYTKRVFSRMGLCPDGMEYEEIQEIFHSKLERDPALFNEYHALIVEHAKRHCRKNPECEGCPVERICRNRNAVFK